MHSSFLSFVCFVAGAASLGAQTVSTPKSPSAETIRLDDVIISASPLGRTAADTAQAATLLTGEALNRQVQPTLGETLAGLPGVSSTWYGPGASRPLIRGLGGERVRILEDSTGMLDASTASPDHAVSVEPFLVESVEVVRGPASLLYGSAAVGGVVNVLTRRIRSELPERPVEGQFDLRYGSAANERTGGGYVDVQAGEEDGGTLVMHLDGFRREADDAEIPGGVIANSSLAARGGAAGLSWIGSTGYAGAAWSGYRSDYGIPGEDVRIQLRQNRVDVRGETTAAFGIFSGARFKLGHGDYEHVELEDGEVGTRFTNTGFDARAELLHADLGGLAGAWGVQAGRSKLAAAGDEAFLPPTLTKNAAVFVFEEFKAGDWRHQFGGRYERQAIDVRDGSGRSRDDGTGSLSLGTVRALSSAWRLAGTVTQTTRAPNAQELFADGPHAGTAAFEIGDAGLRRERSLGAELSLRRREGRITGAFTVFVNKFRGFIFEQATGQVAVEGADGFELVDPADVPPGEESLTVYRYAQDDATFRGAELELVAHLHEGERHQFDARITGDYTRATDGAGRPLPRIPPLRGTFGLDWRQGSWDAGLEWQQVGAQTRTSPGETATDGYAQFNAHLAWRLTSGRHAWDVFVRGTNLTDELARVHTSFLKEAAPLPGRNFTAGVRWAF